MHRHLKMSDLNLRDYVEDINNLKLNIMLTITLINEGISPSVPLTRDFFLKSGTSNTYIKARCEKPFHGTVNELIDIICSYLNLNVDSQILTDHVISSQSTEYDYNGKQLVNEVDFQIYW